MNIAAKYSYIGKTLLMSFLYVPIFPLGLGISLLGFILAYWLEKYNFANMYKKPEMLNRQIVEFYSNYFVLIFFVYGIGDYVFLRDVYEKNTWSLVNIIVFGALIILPYHQLLSIDFLKFEESKIHEQEYKEKYVDFLNDYERANPMTKKEGEMRYLEQNEEYPLKYYRNQINNCNVKGINDILVDEVEVKGTNDYIINPEVKNIEIKKPNSILIEGDPDDDVIINNTGLNSNMYMNERNSNRNIFSNVK